MAAHTTVEVNQSKMPLKNRLAHIILGREHEGRRIRLTAMLVVLVVVMGTGLIMLARHIHQQQLELRSSMASMLNDRGQLILQALQRASDVGASIVQERVHLHDVLTRQSANRAGTQDRKDLDKALDSIFQHPRIDAIELWDAQGRSLGRRGNMMHQSKFQAPILLPYVARLHWDGRFALIQHVKIFNDGEIVGAANVQVTLKEIDHIFAVDKGLGQTGEFVMCARVDARQMTCYPSRWTLNGKAVEPRVLEGNPLPMHHALSGVTGTIVATDHRDKTVLAAHSPIEETGLGLVLKRDQSELYLIAVEMLMDTLPIILFLGISGVLIMRWQLSPLVRNLVASRAQIKSILDHAPDAIVTLNKHGYISTFNPAATRMFGYASEEVEGRRLNMVLEDLLPTATVDVLRTGEVMGKHRDGRRIPLELAIAESQPGSGGHVVIMHDITPRKQAELELKARYTEVRALNKKLKTAQLQLLQSEKMASLGQVLAGVAYEINNPIGYVYSNVDSLASYIQDLFELIEAYEKIENEIKDIDKYGVLQTAKAKADLVFLREDTMSLMQETRDGISRVKKIVQDLKDFSRVDATDEWHWADLRKGLDSTLNIVWSELKYKAEVKKEYADIPEVECLPSQLNQVFLNLLVNAGQAIEGQGVITLRTGQSGDQVWVEVADTGKGIAPEHVTKVFDPFFTTKTVGQGTGLGLSLSYGIVQKHGGRIDVDSTPGKGTSFRIWLPIQQAASKGGQQKFAV